MLSEGYGTWSMCACVCVCLCVTTRFHHCVHASTRGKECLVAIEANLCPTTLTSVGAVWARTKRSLDRASHVL